MKKILFLISTLETGGAQRAFANISLTLPEGWECDFLINCKDKISYDYKGRVLDLGIVPPEDDTDFIYLAKVLIKRLTMLRKLKRSGEYCACISGLTSANLANALIRDKGCLSVTSVRIHTSSTLKSGNYIKGRIKSLATRLFIKLTDLTVCVSENARRDLIEHFEADDKRTFTVYNGYPVEEIAARAKEPLSEAEKRLLDGRILINVGRLSGQKNQASLIRIFAMVRDRAPDTKLIILGEGPRESELKDLARQLGLSDRVVFWGFDKNPYRIIARCHSFIMTSNFEGFPNALAESLCLGIPVVSADCDSGPREILAPDTDINYKVSDKFEVAPYGILCPVPNEQDEASLKIFADAVTELLQNNGLYNRLKESSVERARDFFPEFTTQKWIDIISNYNR